MEYTCVRRAPPEVLFTNKKMDSRLFSLPSLLWAIGTERPVVSKQISQRLFQGWVSAYWRTKVLWLREGEASPSQCFDILMMTCWVPMRTSDFPKETQQSTVQCVALHCQNGSCIRAESTVKSPRGVLSACKYCSTLPATAAQATKVQVIQ